MTRSTSATPAAPRRAVMRVHTDLWDVCEQHIRDTGTGEQAGVLLIRAHDNRIDPTGPVVLTAVRFVPVDERFITDQTHGLSYDGRFHLHCARLAQQLVAGMLLVHAHGHDPEPEPSNRDRDLGSQFLTFATRRSPSRPHGLAVVGDRSIAATVVLDWHRVRARARRRRRIPPQPLAWPAVDPVNLDGLLGTALHRHEQS